MPTKSYRCLFRGILLVVLSGCLSLMVVTTLLHFSSHVHRGLKNLAGGGSSLYQDSAETIFAGPDDINKEISKITASLSSDSIFKLVPVLKEQPVHLSTLQH
jgi:hypothetical protein